MRHLYVILALWIGLGAVGFGRGQNPLWEETRADLAMQRYGVSGAGVVVAVLDRGIDWRHPDFRHPDGTTRILWMLDMTGQNGCPGNPAPVEYSAAQIDQALENGTDLPFRDAVGHGTPTAGAAAGNGRAFANGRYAGLAPEADLIVVKMVSEGAPAHGDQSAEAAFQGCIDDALDWLDAKLNLLDRPCVGIINSGTQWGPIDGTSAVSRKIDQVFGADRPGRIYVSPSGDEGNLPTHAAADYDVNDTTVAFTKTSAATAFLSVWYTGAAPAEVTVAFNDGTSVGPVGPSGSRNQDGIFIIQYAPGSAFYPWRSNGPDRAIWIRITGHIGPGTVTLRGTTPTAGRFDLYHGQLPNVLALTSHLAPGRLTDYSATRSAIVVGAYVLNDRYRDLSGIERFVGNEGGIGESWAFSSDGPTRDGRTPGVDIAAPGHNVFAAFGQQSWWRTFEFNLIQDGSGWYGRFGATSGAAPIVVGAVALMLEADPNLTADDVRSVLRATARNDAFTGAVPNPVWGFGKLDVLAALDRILALPGDLNCDGAVSVGDINPFVLALTDPDAYRQQFPDCSSFNGDINDDGVVTVGDINGFVALVIGG